MARPSTWIPRVPVILAALESSTEERFSRPEVEQLFGVSPSRAKTLMQVAGGRHTKGVWSIPRQKLLDYVKFSPEAHEFRAHEERQKDLMVKLQNAEKEARLRRVEIPQASRDEWPVLKDLLPKLVFTPGAFTVAHCGTEDLLHTLWLLGQCLGTPGDYQKFKEMVETKQERMSA